MAQIAIVVRGDHLRRELRGALAGAGYPVAVIPSGGSLLTQLATLAPSLVLIQEPDAGILVKIRRTLPDAALVTAHAGSTHLRIPDNAVDFIVQPIRPAELRARIRRALATRAKRAPRREGQRENEVLPHLHDPVTGRLDAKAIAHALGIPLSELSKAIGKPYKAVFKAPSSVSLQPLLAPTYAVLVPLSQVYPDAGKTRAWLNAPNRALDDMRPIDLVLTKRAEIVSDMLNGILWGVPT